MSTMIDAKLLEKAVKLHGHLGPFLVLGLKMSLRAEEVLGQKPNRCELETVNSKPYLCVVDGIKAFLEQCTVTIREGEGLTAKYTGVDGKEIVVKVKKELVNKYAKVPWEKCEEYAHEVIRSSNEQLFE
ncbi:MAG: FmdE family protein [Candidatus Bathyarchaeia archaeon]